MESPLEVLRNAQHETFHDARSRPLVLELRPALSGAEIQALEDELELPLPPEVRELLAFSSGFLLGDLIEVRFRGGEVGGIEKLFPKACEVANDGAGNSWFVDIDPESGGWGPVFFACHDPPAVLIQSASLAQFIVDALDLGREHTSRNIVDAREDALTRIWKSDPHPQAVGALRKGEDPVLQERLKDLSPELRVCDLRQAEVGMGFALKDDRDGFAGTRLGHERLFLLPPARRGFFQRLFGR